MLYNDRGIFGGGGVCVSEVLDTGCRPAADANPFAGVVDGFVRLRGPLRRWRVYTHPAASPDFLWSHFVHVEGSP